MFLCEKEVERSFMDSMIKNVKEYDKNIEMDVFKNGISKIISPNNISTNF